VQVVPHDLHDDHADGCDADMSDKRITKRDVVQPTVYLTSRLVRKAEQTRIEEQAAIAWDWILALHKEDMKLEELGALMFIYGYMMRDWMHAQEVTF